MLCVYLQTFEAALFWKKTKKIALKNHAFSVYIWEVILDLNIIGKTHYLVHAAHEALCQFYVSMFSWSLLVPRLSRPTDWSKVFIDCIHVVFCRPLGLVAGSNACLAGVPSGSLKMCPVNLSLF